MAFLDFFGKRRAAAAGTQGQWDAALSATRRDNASADDAFRENRPHQRTATVPRAIGLPPRSVGRPLAMAAIQTPTTEPLAGAIGDMVTRPITNAPLASADGGGPTFANPQFESVRAVVGAILRRWPLLMLSMLTSLLLAILFLLVATPRYISTAKILLDSQPKRVVDGAVVQSGLGSSAAGADTLLVDSQVELIQSAAVLRRIVDTEKLSKDPEFAVPHGGGVRIMLRNSLGIKLFGHDREFPPKTNPDDIALWRFTDKHLRVRRDGNTYAIQIGVMSQDPAKAARLANAVAQAYVKEGVQSASDTTRMATGDLDSRIADLRSRVQKAENDVETWKAKNGLIGIPGLLLTEQQMSQLNDKLGLARAATAIAKARYEQVKDLSSRSGGSALGAQSDALKSNVVANLRQSLSRLERQEAVVQQTLRPGHPDYAKSATEKRSVLAQLDDELNRIKANAKAEFELSQVNERATADELKLAEGKTTVGNQAQVKLRELQRTLESERAVYQQFLNRANETREQADLSRPTSRIISPATVAPFPSFPPTMLTILGSLGGGLMLGAGLAWLQHLVQGSQPAIPRPQRSLFHWLRPSGRSSERAGTRDGEIHRETSPAGRTDHTTARVAEVRIRPTKFASSAAEAETGNASLRRGWPPRGMSARSTVPPTTTLPESAAATGASRIAAQLRANAGVATVTRPSQFATPASRRPPSVPILRIAGHVDRFALPSPGSFARLSFTDHLTAVEATRPQSEAHYRSAIDQLLAMLARSATADMPLITLVAGTDVGVGTSSTALSLAYRAANTGTRTLLIDACSTDAHLSQRLARSLVQTRPCVLDSDEHLAEITMQDGRTGLSLLPLAFTSLANFSPTQQARLLKGLRKLSNRYELVLIDVGAAATNRGAIFLGQLTDRMLIVTCEAVADPLLTAANFSVDASLATVITTPSSLVA